MSNARDLADIAADPEKVLPDQADNEGKVLTTDGTNTSWENISPEPLFLTGAI